MDRAQIMFDISLLYFRNRETYLTETKLINNIVQKLQFVRNLNQPA